MFPEEEGDWYCLMCGERAYNPLTGYVDRLLSAIEEQAARDHAREHARQLAAAHPPGTRRRRWDSIAGRRPAEPVDQPGDPSVQPGAAERDEHDDRGGRRPDPLPTARELRSSSAGGAAERGTEDQWRAPQPWRPELWRPGRAGSSAWGGRRRSGPAAGVPGWCAETAAHGDVVATPSGGDDRRTGLVCASGRRWTDPDEAKRRRFERPWGASAERCRHHTQQWWLRGWDSRPRWKRRQPPPAGGRDPSYAALVRWR